MRNFSLRKTSRKLFPYAVSLACVIFLIRTADWHEALHILRAGLSWWSLFWFMLLAAMIAIVFGLRWRLLVGGRLGYKPSLVAAILVLGGNMFLPARGGDLLRLQYTHKAANISYADAFGRLVAEKVVDLGTIALMGIFGILALQSGSVPLSFGVLPGVLTLSLALLLALIIAFRFHGAAILASLKLLCSLVRARIFLKTTSSISCSIRATACPFGTCSLPVLSAWAIWGLGYAPAYILVSHALGMALTYPESLFVVFAGAMSLMIPAAPSGIGSFHASIVSAFVFLKRPPTEGLLLAMAIHFSFSWSM